MDISLKRIPLVRRWLTLSLLPLALFCVYTALVWRGNMAALTMQQEQWVLQRPLTRFDCVVFQWRSLGEAPVSLFLLLALGGVACWWFKYRLRVLFALLLLLGAGLGVEYLGKQYIVQPTPPGLQEGMDDLACPQAWHMSGLKRIPLTLGAWWLAPRPPQWRIAEAQRATTIAYSTDVSNQQDYYAYAGYPSGHAYRWLLIGLVACWLAWRQIRKGFWRWLAMIFFLALAIGGGIGQFYIGSHLFSDLIGGYLLGAFLACCAIAVLQMGERRNRWRRCDPPALPIAENNDTLLPEKR